MLRTKLIASIIFIILLQGFSYNAKADHSAGGELIYEYLGDSTYRFVYKFYRDCTGINASNILYMCAVNNCSGANFISQLSKVKTLPNGDPNGRIIGNGCPSYLNTCQDPSATLPAYEEWWYEDTIQIIDKCTDWVFSVAQSSRNVSANIAPNVVDDLVLIARLNNIDAPNNSSAYFSVPPVTFTCINAPYRYNNGVIDPDGDSLVFLPQTPIVNATCTKPVVTTGALYNGKTPPLGLPGNPFQTNNTYSLNPSNGNLSFTPGELGPQTISFRVEEYRNGKLISTVMRDIQIRVMNCTTPPITMEIDTNTIKDGKLVNGTIEACANDTLEFCFDVKTIDITAKLAISDNHSFSIPNATITYANNASNYVRGCIKWRPGTADSGLNILTISAKDSTCKAPGVAVTQTFTIPLYINYTPKPSVTTPQIFCEGQTVGPLTANGSNLLWYQSASGSFGDPNAPTPSTSAIAKTFYYVTQEVNGCTSDRQPLLVDVKQGPKFNLKRSEDSICWYDDVLFYNDISDTALYTRSWTVDSGRIISGNRTDSIIADWSKSGLRTVILTMANSICSVSDSIDIYVKPTPVSYVEMKKYGCLGEEITLSPYKNDHPTNYYWSVDEQQIYDTSYVPTYKFKWNTLGKKRVTLYTEGKNGCKGNTYDTTISIHDYPIADITGPDFNDICYGKEFELSSPEGLRYKYSWTPPLSYIGFDNNKATVRAEQTGYLHLEVTNIWDCSSVDSFYIDARPCCEVIMPDAFTPNQDGRNDTYKPLKANNHSIISFTIYNRWGQQVYQSRDISKGWDGMFKNTPQSMDTYHYLLEYLCNGNEGQQRTEKGNFILIR